ncbi:MAG: hypothetical protein K2X81_26280 [Candidatus Obscuribacterales bacterium]|nr:hypothetical protein [Candidatus Obscuribacterales bacterium]
MPGKYDDATQNLYKVDYASKQNIQTINDGVRTILENETPTTLVFQAAEQRKGTDVQIAANTILNASLGSVDSGYTSIHTWWKTDILGNLIQNSGQLIGQWLSEFCKGWIADAAQYLSGFLRVFVLNPNIAVNGLNNGQNDGISPYIRQAADVMYGIAIDILLLLFILCIWRVWATSAWKGEGTVMSAVGRLIFTSGLLLGWPTIYAFVIQISNEMIKAVYANNPQQILMLDYAMAQVVKGGVLAAGAAATSAFAPVLGNATVPVVGPLLGNVFSLGSTLLYTILASILITELIYILVLKATQTALLTAQYMFAPIFLVFFALPDTEDYATGYVKAFVETSLWTFIWVGLLKILVIVLFSSFNPWGKILIAIGVLQLMIQVPTFLARAQISPASDFFSAGFAMSNLTKAVSEIKDSTGTAINRAVSFYTSGSYADKGLNTTMNPTMENLSTQVCDPNRLQTLNQVSATERNRSSGTLASAGSSAVSASVLNGPALKTQGNLSSSLAQDGGGRPIDLTNTPAPPIVSHLSGQKITSLNSTCAAPAKNVAFNAAQSAEPSNRFEWSNPPAEGWDQAGLVHVDARKMIGALTAIEGVGLSFGHNKSSAIGSLAHGVQRINIAQGANDVEKAHAIYAASFAHNIASDDPAKDAARRAAIQHGNNQPSGIMENICANWLSNTGSSWSTSAIAKERFQQGMFSEAVAGSQAYLNNQQGNAYTEYLRSRYGEKWGAEQDAQAVHFMSNPDSSESPWNRAIAPATQALVASGIAVSPNTRGAMQNPAVQSMHPARKKQAVHAILNYVQSDCKVLYGQEDAYTYALAHGEMARALPADEVNAALVMYQINGQNDICSPMARNYIQAANAVSRSTQQDFDCSYKQLIYSSGHKAQSLGYLPGNYDISGISSFAEIEAAIVHSPKESKSNVMQQIIESASSDAALSASTKFPFIKTQSQSMPNIAAAISIQHLSPGLNQIAGFRSLNTV